MIKLLPILSEIKIINKNKIIIIDKDDSQREVNKKKILNYIKNNQELKKSLLRTYGFIDRILSIIEDLLKTQYDEALFADYDPEIDDSSGITFPVIMSIKNFVMMI